MTVRVLFFSVLQDISGVPEIEWEVPADAPLADLLEAMFVRWPELKRWESSLLFAVNHDYVKRDAVLTEGCEVALMPPVQGG